MNFSPGDEVVFTADNLGVQSPDNPYKFDPDVIVSKGEKGVVKGEHPQLSDWIDVTYVRDGKEYNCPVHDSHIVKVTP